MVNISIIVPFRNRKQYIEKCLENIRQINYENYEIIFINDGSDEETTEYAKKIIEKYENKEDNKDKEYNKNREIGEIRYYYIDKKSEGVGNARNYGIERSNGKYIMFLDVDDEIQPNLFIKLQKYIDEEVDMIKYKMKIINERQKTPTFEKTKGEEAFNKLYHRDKYLDSPCLYLIKRELFERTKLRFKPGIYHEDFALMPLLIVNAKTFVSTRYYGYNYIQTENSIIRNQNYEMLLKKVNDKLCAYDDMINEIEKINISSTTKSNIKKYYTNSILIALNDLRKDDRQIFEQSIRKRKMIKNIKCDSLKQIIKRIILLINIEWYLKLVKD